jgi:hypothetical protein
MERKRAVNTYIVSFHLWFEGSERKWCGFGDGREREEEKKKRKKKIINWFYEARIMMGIARVNILSFNSAAFGVFSVIELDGMIALAVIAVHWWLVGRE